MFAKKQILISKEFDAQASDQVRNIWERELEKKLTTVAENWEKCITSVRLLE